MIVQLYHKILHPRVGNPFTVEITTVLISDPPPLIIASLFPTNLIAAFSFPACHLYLSISAATQ